MPDVDQSNDRVPQNSAAGQVVPEEPVFQLEDIWKLPGAFFDGLIGLGDSEPANVRPDVNQSNDKVPQNSSVEEVVPKAEAETAYLAFLEEVLFEYPKAVLGDVIEGVDGFFEWLDSEESGVEETESERPPEESEIEEKQAEKARTGAESKAEAEKAPNTVESKTGSVAEASETARRTVEAATIGASERKITVTISNAGSVIEQGNAHSVTPGEFVKFFKEVEVNGFETKVMVDTRTAAVYSFESGSNGFMNLTEHPNLVAVITEAHANGEPATRLTAPLAEGLPVVSIDFEINSAERALEGGPEAREGMPRSAGLVEFARNPSESKLKSEGVAESRIGNQPLKSLGQGLAPREGAESRPVKVLADVDEPHDSFLEIGGGAVALGLVAWWGADWYFSSQEDQAKSSKPSQNTAPTTGVEP